LHALRYRRALPGHTGRSAAAGEPDRGAMERERGGSRSQRTRGGGHFALRVLREPRALFWGRATHPTLPTGRPHVKCWRRAAATHGKADRRTAARPSAPGAASRRLRTSSPAGVPTQALGADSSDRRRTCDRDVSGDSPKETVAARRVDNDHGRRSEGDRRLTASHWSTWEMKRASGSGAPSNLPSPDPPIVNGAIYQTVATIWLPVCHTPRQSG
jgi:hypothetical protein